MNMDTHAQTRLYTMCTLSITWCCPKGHRSTALGRATVKIPQVAIVGGSIRDGEHLRGALAPRSTDRLRHHWHQGLLTESSG